MPFLEWTDAFNMGIAEIDQQHQRLLELLNELHDASERSDSLATLASVLDELEAVKHGMEKLDSYASYHFETEQRYMTRHAYTDSGRHQQEHAAFSAAIKEFRHRDAMRKQRLCPQIMTFCRDWWQDHVQGADKKLGAFLVERGLK